MWNIITRPRLNSIMVSFIYIYIYIHILAPPVTPSNTSTSHISIPCLLMTWWCKKPRLTRNILMPAWEWSHGLRVPGMGRGSELDRLARRYISKFCLQHGGHCVDFNLLATNARSYLLKQTSAQFKNGTSFFDIWELVSNITYPCWDESYPY